MLKFFDKISHVHVRPANKQTNTFHLFM